MITASSVKPEIASWRAVEALRAGVPNCDAVQALGCSHPLVEERFRSMLAEIDLGFSRGKGTQGVLVAGDSARVNPIYWNTSSTLPWRTTLSAAKSW